MPTKQTDERVGNKSLIGVSRSRGRAMRSRIYFYSTLTFYGTGNQGEADDWAGGRRAALGQSPTVRPSAGGIGRRTGPSAGRLPGPLETVGDWPVF